MRKEILLISLILVFSLASPAKAQTQPTGGQLIFQTVFDHVFDDFYQQVMVMFGASSTSFDVDPVRPLNDTSRDDLTQEALDFLGLNLSQVTNFNSEDIYLESLFDATSSISVSQSDDAIVLGDPQDYNNILVVQGTVTVTTTETTTETRNYKLSLTGDVLEDGGPGPVGNAAVPEPATVFLFGGGLLGALARRNRFAK